MVEPFLNVTWEVGVPSWVVTSSAVEKPGRKFDNCSGFTSTPVDTQAANRTQSPVSA